MKDSTKSLLAWVLTAMIVGYVFHALTVGSHHQRKVEHPSFSAFLNKVDSGSIQSVTMNGRQIRGTTQGGHPFITYMPSAIGGSVVGEMIKHHVKIAAAPPQHRSVLMMILIDWSPMLLLIGVWVYYMRKVGGGGKGGGLLSFNKSKARMVHGETVRVRFSDVAGAEEAKEEVSELVDFLRDPARFQRLGGRIPKGVMMVGPPGTGKTLLAKAIAGEARVPFFNVSGSSFVEMFVGVGASRVRNLFEQARKQAPCIVFIDEMDALGRRRGNGMGGGHDEREQTLNQLLVEMDGFEGTEGVIVIAATNRPDVLDKALLRPGRFDRQVVVGLPDIRGREAILKVHMRRVAVDRDVDASIIARGTPGFSGADLANLVNEAALFAARANRRTVDMESFEKAKDKILMGAERRSMVMSEREKRLTAYHEAGHAIVGLNVPAHDPVYKVSIMPRGRALGITMFLPEEDRRSYTREQLESQLSSLFGGRLAEEMVFGPQNVTTGAANDIERATEIARNMVTRWGLSDHLGPLVYGDERDAAPFPVQSEMSDDTASAIDAEVRAVIERNYERAKGILEENIDKLHAMAHALVRFETIDRGQIDEILDGRDPTPPREDETDDGGPEAGDPQPEPT